MDTNIRRDCVNAAKALRDELDAKAKKMKTSPQQVRIARFADSVDVMLKIGCVLGDLPMMPIFKGGKLSFVAVTKKRPKFTFKLLGLAVGDKLYFTKDESVVAVMSDINKNKVSLIVDGRIETTLQSLTALTHKLLKTKFPPQPTPYWKFEGKTLLSYYDKAFPLT